MRLTELEPHFIRYEDRPDGDYMVHYGVTLVNADGIRFLCPVCFKTNGGPVGTHSVICNRPCVPQGPNRVGPGRWEFSGAGYDDLTLSPSILLPGPGCGAHFFIRNGNIE